MASVVRMPGVAADATEAVLAEWLVEESGEFAAADAIATVETDKAAVDIEADAAGRMLKTLVPPGAQVEVGAPIAVVGEVDEQVDDVDALLATLGVEPATDVVVPERRDIPADPESAAPVAEEIESPPASPPRPSAPRRPGTGNGRVFSSPLARQIAKEHGLAIEEIEGTGPRGRILRRDVDAAVVSMRGAEPAAQPSQPTSGPMSGPISKPRKAADAAYEEIPHSRLRLAAARRLTESQQQAPHFYLRGTARAEALVALRTELNHDEVRVSISDLVVKAVSVAHRRVPEMNVTWTSQAVRRYVDVDVAVAVATERGLLTPVVRDVASRPLTAVALSLRDLADRARSGRLRQDELEGGSITVSNLGMYGAEEFAALLNPPHAAILAVGAVRAEPVVEGDAVVPGQVLSLTLSVDHRPVDGALAARWFAVLKELLEHPVRMLA